jgi:hypothetical protein
MMAVIVTSRWPGLAPAGQRPGWPGCARGVSNGGALGDPMDRLAAALAGT